MKQTLTVNLEKDFYEELKKEAKELQLPLTSYVRMILANRKKENN